MDPFWSQELFDAADATLVDGLRARGSAMAITDVVAYLRVEVERILRDEGDVA